MTHIGKSITLDLSAETRQRLFNGIVGHRPPFWKAYRGLVVRPAIIDGEEIRNLPYEQRARADLWSVYGDCPARGERCFTDTGEGATEADAIAIAAEIAAIARLSGFNLPISFK